MNKKIILGLSVLLVALFALIGGASLIAEDFIKLVKATPSILYVVQSFIGLAPSDK